MFTLIGSLLSSWKPNYDEFNILLLGIDQSGKTAYLEYLKHIYLDTKFKSFNQISQTIGFNQTSILHYNSSLNTYFKLNIWDLGGSKDLRSIWNNYILDCHAIFYFIDATLFTDPANDIKLQDSIFAFKNALTLCLGNVHLSNIPILFAISKSDLLPKLGEQERIIKDSILSKFVHPFKHLLDNHNYTILFITINNKSSIVNTLDWSSSNLYQNMVSIQPDNSSKHN